MKSLSLLLLLFSLLNFPLAVGAVNSPPPPTSPATSVPVKTDAEQPSPDEKAPPAPKPKLLAEPPVSQHFIKAASPEQFSIAVSRAGKYSLKLPKSFGEDPFAQLKNIDDISLLRKGKATLIATNLLDYSDSFHYKATQSLPDFPEATPVMTWKLNSISKQEWTCRLMKEKDFNGERCILRATSKVGGIAYELLFLMPKQNHLQYLSEAIYSIYSFTL